ncbi:MAG: R3H domain-containing nucleic acid-binding protein [bacterium]|nr:R3H domain-containing nucleic acid-binding protein [bacterium]
MCWVEAELPLRIGLVNFNNIGMEAAFIQKTIEEILNKLSAEATFAGIVEINNGDIIKFSIKTNEPYLLIGDDGQVLMALNHVVKKIFESHAVKNNFKPMNFIVDVNDYQEQKIEDIKNKARMMAERARFFKNNVELPAMNPYERMIVHSFFTNATDIETESTGVGPERRVVIKYVGTVE